MVGETGSVVGEPVYVVGHMDHLSVNAYHGKRGWSSVEATNACAFDLESYDNGALIGASVREGVI